MGCTGSKKYTPDFTALVCKKGVWNTSFAIFPRVYVEIIFWMGWIRYICELHLFLFTFFSVTRRKCSIASVAHIWFLLNLCVLNLLLICWAFSHTVHPALGLIFPLLTLHPPGLCVVASPYPSLLLPLFTGQTRSSGSQCCLFCSWV